MLHGLDGDTVNMVQFDLEGLYAVQKGMENGKMGLLNCPITLPLARLESDIIDFCPTKEGTDSVV